MSIRALMWKEYRETRMIWLTILILGCATLFIAPPIMEAFDLGTASSHPHSLSGILGVLCITFGLITGAVAFAGERENRTLDFLDVVTASRRDIWMGKVLFGVSASLSLGLGLAVAYTFTPWNASGFHFQRFHLFFVLPTLTLGAYCWGLLGSALFLTAMQALAFSVLIYVVSAYLLGILVSLGGAFLGSHLILSIAAALGSLLAFQKNPPTNAQSKSVQNRQTKQSHQGIRALLWLASRQQGGFRWTILCVALVLGLSLGNRGLVYWPLGTLAIGVACGLSVWGGDQAGQQQRFLGDQRFTPNTIWLTRTMLWLGTGLLAVGLWVLGAAIYMMISGRLNEDWTIQRLLVSLDREVVHLESPILYAGIWFIYAFAASQFFGMLCRQFIVAVFVSVASSLAFIAPWLSICFTGHPPWISILVVPLFLVLLSRLLYWSWVSENMTTRRAMAVIVSGPLLITMWIIASLWWRAVEIPDVGPPEGIERACAVLNKPGNRRTADKIRQALRSLLYARRATHFQSGNRDVHSWLYDVRTKGWKKAPEGLKEWIDDLMAKPWNRELAEAVRQPICLLSDPRRESTPSPDTRDAMNQLKDVLSARMIQAQAEGRPEESLDHLETLLALSRHVRYFSSGQISWEGDLLEARALATLGHWIQKIGPKRDLLRRALKILKSHQQARPLQKDIAIASYLGRWHWLGQVLWGGQAAQMMSKEDDRSSRLTPREVLLRQVVRVSFMLPWERQRAERLLSHQYHDFFQTGKVNQNRARGLSWIGWMTTNWIGDSGLGSAILQARIVQVALTLFEVEKGKQAQALEELVPQYLQSLPHPKMEYDVENRKLTHPNSKVYPIPLLRE